MSTELLDLMATLDAIRAAMEGRGSSERARFLAQTVVDRGVKSPAVEDRLALMALYRVSGRSPTNVRVNVDLSTPENKVLSTIADAWVSWLLDRDGKAVSRLSEAVQTIDREIIDISVLNGMTLKFWAEACLAFANASIEDSKRLFERALEYGGQFGTESYPAVQWSYVAAFWA
jgi:hypothetical protein